MNKLAICNEMFEGWDIEEVFKFAAEVGYQGVEIAPFTLAKSVEDISGERRKQILNAAKKESIEIVGLHWLLASPSGLYINHTDEKIRQKTVNYLKSLINLCADLDGHIMVFGSPKQRDILPAEDFESTWERTVDSFRQVLPLAEKRKVYICFEPLAPRETNFINTVEEGVRLVEEVNHPHFLLHLDVKAMSAENKPLGEIIRTGAKHLHHFHVNDDNGRAPGFGNADYEQITQALKDINYQGFLSVEVFDFKPDPRTIAKESMTYLKKFFSVK